MGLLSFLKRSAAAADAGSPEGLRRRARRRLIGAAVLVLVGVVVLPLLFDTTPRPVAVDIPIEIPAKDKVAPLAATGSRAVASGKLAAVTTDAPREVSPPPAEPSPTVEKPAEPAAPAAEKSTESSPRQADKPAETNLPAPASPTPPVPVKAAVPAARYVVQVGAFSEAASARTARQRVEKLGLKTYTQVVETSSGARTRVRIGPYEERAEAERVAAKIKQAGLPAAVLGL